MGHPYLFLQQPEEAECTQWIQHAKSLSEREKWWEEWAWLESLVRTIHVIMLRQVLIMNKLENNGESFLPFPISHGSTHHIFLHVVQIM